jgi:acyl dehydratase
MIEPGPKAADLRFRDIELGQTFELERTFTVEDVERFAAVSEDWSPLHVDHRRQCAGSGGGQVMP